MPRPTAPTPVRFATTQPTQALALLNSDFLNHQAELLAAPARAARPAPKSPRRSQRALRLATARAPQDAEIRRGVALIAALKTQGGASGDDALRAFCLVVLNLNEFLYID